MKAVRILSMVMCLVVLFGAPALAAKADSKAKAEILANFGKVSEAYAKKDIGFIVSVYADDPDVVAVGSAESEKCVGKAQIREAVEKFLAAAQSIKVDYSDILVKMRGKHAWTYCDSTAHIIWANGKESNIKGRITLALEKRKGQWKVIQSHFSLPMAEPK